jgi:hypothetical protein
MEQEQAKLALTNAIVGGRDDDEEEESKTYLLRTMA